MLVSEIFFNGLSRLGDRDDRDHNYHHHHHHRRRHHRRWWDGRRWCDEWWD